MIGRLIKFGALFSAFLAGIATALWKIAPLRRSRAPHREKGPGPAKDKPRNRWWTLAKHFALFAILLALGGFLIAVSGIIPLKASSGHWPITRWFLNFSMRRSVVTHSIGIKPPALEDRGLIMKGAGHFDFGCRPCHGSPDQPQPTIPHQMTPHPPYLPRVIPEWDSAELFYIVKHGVKFTGMPAWPSQERDDEVWAVVAFLRELPGLSAEEYRELATGRTEVVSGTPAVEGLLEPEAAVKALLESCARCHGFDGLGRGEGVFPVLAGQTAEYLYASLRAYAVDERQSGIMAPVAAGLRNETMRSLARYYADLERRGVAPVLPGAEKSIEEGRSIAMNGIPEQGVPACADCHGPTSTPRNPVYPILSGQYAEYLVLQLELFRKGHRGGTEYAHLMRHVATRMTTEQFRSVALYYSSQRDWRK